MSAWADMQQEWSKNYDEKLMTGILLWDLSAAYDTLDANYGKYIQMVVLLMVRNSDAHSHDSGFLITNHLNI